MKQFSTFLEFINEGYSSGDKKALLDDLSKSIEHIRLGDWQKSLISTSKVISDSEIEIELNFEIITLKITKVRPK